MEQALRLKREAAERAFEAQAEKDRTLIRLEELRAFEAQAKKDRTLIRLEELRFLATNTKDLDDDDAYWITK
nr:hypothetical protein [Tanacetum cinerariifolium]